MENVKKNQTNQPYYLGLDIGTDSVGYAVTTENYEPIKSHGEPMLGVTLFDEPSLSDKRRSFRSARRRLHRRQQRVALIQDLFSTEIGKTDPTFFIRMKESALLKEDKSVIVGTEWDNEEYKKKYKTIHHLLSELMNSDDKYDLRLIYIACAWLIAHRGHFLYDIDGESVDNLTDIKPAYTEFEQWFIDNDYVLPWECDAESLSEILKEKEKIAEKKKKLITLLSSGGKSFNTPEECPVTGKIIDLLAGASVKPKDLFNESVGDFSEISGSIKLDSPDKTEDILTQLGDFAELIIRIQAIYDCAVLSQTLSGKDSISGAKMEQYELHKSDLKELKDFIKEYCYENYKAVFRDENGKGYAAYIKKSNEETRTDLENTVKKIIKEAKAKYGEDIKYADNILKRLDSGTYMPKQVNSDNRVIPHQLYYYELKKILEKAEKHYSFLTEKDSDGLTVSDKIKSVFMYRIPYFVGPLNKDSDKAWIERKADKIYPWNFDKVVDKDASEQAFIDRMTNKCSYLPSEDVLPKNSLLYCKFTVLNEINNIKINDKPITVELKQKIFNEVFKPNGKNGAKVTVKRITDFLISNNDEIDKDSTHLLSGLDTDIKSSMKPLFDFNKYIKSGKLTEEDVEKIIVFSTYIEDKRRLSDRIAREFKQLSKDEARDISRKKYSDFGRLSNRLLNGIEGTRFDGGEVGTVMYFLWNTNDNLMQILEDETKYDFKSIIQEERRKYYDANPKTMNDRLDEMYISNAVKRPIFRTMEIVSDVIKIMGCNPKKIFVEMARGASDAQKNKRTEPRKQKILEMFKNSNADNIDELRRELDELGEDANQKLQSEALYLYFTQMGKCMYCGERLNINELKSGVYNIDHIIPQCMKKDDSIQNNKVLVHSHENGKKTDEYPLSPEIRNKMIGFWSALVKHDKNTKEGNITEEKFRRLTRSTKLTADEKEGFIARQLVETRQSTKAVTNLLHEKFNEKETDVVFVKAGLVSDFRNEYGSIKNKAFNLNITNEEQKNLNLVKCRSINDIHHAQDAYLNIVAGNVYHERFSKNWFNITEDVYSLNLDAIFGNTFFKQPNVWTPEKHLPIVDKAMNNQHIHLTKYQTCQKGGFFDQMPLKAGDSDLIPRKKELPTEKYGGYNKATASFFTLVSYMSGKKKELTFVPVDLLIADRFNSDLTFKEQYIKQKLGEKAKNITFPFDRIIKINTVLSLDGFEVVISCKDSGGARMLLRSMNTAVYSNDYIAYMKNIDNITKKFTDNPQYIINEKYSGVSSEKNLALYDFVVGKINGAFYSKMPGAALLLDENNRNKFASLTLKEQTECLNELVSYLKTNRSGGCNLEKIGKAKSSGVVYLSANVSNWKYSDIRIIDRSASGLYEKRSVNLKDYLV